MGDVLRSQPEHFSELIAYSEVSRTYIAAIFRFRVNGSKESVQRLLFCVALLSI